MPNMHYAVEIQGLTKRFGAFQALNNMSLRLEAGKIYGLLGRNGAGKTTLLNILSARIFATSGDALVFGHAAYEHVDTLKNICFIEEKGLYHAGMRVWQALQLSSGLYPHWDEAYAQRLLKLFELNPKKKYKELSRGMESALGLIIGMASRAPLTIFDEPSLGLDAVIRERFYQALIEDYSEHPRTIIISTHLIDEVSGLFEDVVIIDGGKLLLSTDCADLRSRAFYLSGKESDVRAAAEGCVILSEERIGGTLILSVLTQTALPASPTVEKQSIPLQKLFTQLINPDLQAQLKKGGVIQ